MIHARILDGKKVADEWKIQIKAAALGLPRAPALAVIIVGEDPASHIYVKNKQKACEAVGFMSYPHYLASDISEQELLYLLHQLNNDETIDGILVQLPLPSQIQTQTIIEAINPNKDVDGFHPYHIGRLSQQHPTLRPCTPFGIIKLLEYYHIEVTGLNTVIIGASNIVGRPMALELLIKKATVTVCHSQTKNLQQHISNADLLIAAAGQMDIVQSEWLKPGVIIIDVGIHRLPNGSIRGDIDFEKAKNHASYITPVPGGIGPMTIAALLYNTLLCCNKK